MSQNPGSDLRGGSRLAVEATRAVADLVEAMHRRIAGPFALLSAPAYGGVRGVASLVGAGLDGLLARLAPLAGDAPGGPEREALVAALNGVLGDHLEATGNPLAILDLSSSPTLDLAGARLVGKLQAGLAEMDCRLRVVGARGAVRDLLRAEGLEERIGGLDRQGTVAELVDAAGSGP